MRTALRSQPTTTVPRLRRAVACLVAVSIIASLFAAFAANPANAAASNNFWYRDGSAAKVFGPNSTVMIDGTLRYDDTCIYDEGIKDFFYPATDVYVVPTGSAGALGSKLTDVSGDVPNTIVGVGDGSFLDEVIGFTSPAGNIGTGVFDLVFDTCQDGFFTADDNVFPKAITVALPETLPPVSPAITQLKERARQEYVEWLQFHTLLTAVLNIEKAKEVIACIVSASPICLMQVLAVIFDEGTIGARQAASITNLAGALVLNVAKNHGAIWKDPADPVFERLPVLDRPSDGDLPSSGQDLADAFAGLLPDLADEAALTEALLHAIERYQGAQQAGDGEWALVQARAARDLSDVLADHLGTSEAIDDLRNEIAADAAGLTAGLQQGAAFANRVRKSGFSTDEDRALRNQGLSTADIVELEGSFVRTGYLPSYSATDLLDQLDDLAASRAAMASTLGDNAAGWDAVVSSLEGAGRRAPEADAGGPYTASAGTPLSLDGGGSAAAPGAELTAHEWDLDADGEFDDASGATPTITAPAGHPVIVSLRVTDDAGRQAVDHALVTVTAGDRAPSIGAKAPSTATDVTVGDDVTFTVTATDPEGADLSHTWAIDGEAVSGSSSSFTWTPTAADIGSHTVVVRISDGTTTGTLAAWRATVTMPDADGDGWTTSTDCDDTRADVSPSQFERLGNDRDDDCNAATPDAPPGGLTGALWSWGHYDGVGTGTTTDKRSPIPVPGLTDVVQIASTRATAFAVLSSGEVRSWGQNHRGMLGNGTDDSHRTPRSVVGVKGHGILSDIVQVDSEIMHTVALDKDGNVVAWGNNENGQSGNDATTAHHRSPVDVITADGTPLEDVRAVEAGTSESYALLSDGSVASWGTARCRGQSPHPISRTAAPVPLFGKDIVQIAAGQNMVLARKADGSVWACAGDDELMDRASRGLSDVQRATPAPMRSFGPGSGVIDVSSGGDAAVALKADGSVWLWGKNVNGPLNPLGVPANEIVATPRQVVLPPGPPVVDVEMDATCHGLAIRADGSVLSWGCNPNGAAGVGVFTDPVPGLHVLDLGDNATFSTSASAWNGYTLVRPVDDDAIVRPAPWVTVTAEDASIGESTGGTVTLSLSEAAPADLSVTWAVEDGKPSTITIPAGETSVAVPVSVTDDDLDEEDEELAFHVLAVSHGVRIERRSAVVTVVDDDAPPSVSVDPVTIVEGDTSLTDVKVVVRLSRPSGKDVEVLWSTSDGTATSPADYGSASGHVLVPAGATEASFHLAVAGDTDMEPEEGFDVHLSDPVHATIGTGDAEITIVDDEPIVVRASSPTVTEGNGGTTAATFIVTVTAPPTGTSVSVPWQVKAGTAGVPADVEEANDSLTFDAANPSQTVTVQVVGDTVVEQTEVFRLALGAASASDGRTVVVAEPAVGVVLDDDVATDPGEDPDEEPDPTFEFDGFFQPVDNLPAVNAVQAGRAIPVKFSLGGDHGLDIFEAAHPRSQVVGCTAGAALDTIEQTVSPGASELTYDAATDRYQYVWKTEKAWKGQCRQFVVRFVDGTEATALFHLK